jgi:hypothetical protein
LWFCIVNDGQSTCVQIGIRIVRLEERISSGMSTVLCFPLAANYYQVQLGAT